MESLFFASSGWLRQCRKPCWLLVSWPAILSLLLGLMLVPSASAVTNGAEKPGFNEDIRPILSDSCFVCHGPDKNNRKAKLRLDVREVALQKKAIVPGKPDQSEMIRRIYATNKDDMMPPPDSRKALNAEQKELLKKWIASGAEYQPHWAYIKPERPKIPEVKYKSWEKNPIDAFILAQLEKHNIKPSREADKGILLRRLSLDLIGLPPTLEEVQNFIKDTSPNAYEHEVDRLLASPHYGERMAVEWLDLARFTDTVGYHGDQNINDFPFRDYVINAYHSNKPFDQFTIEQLAGDLLPHPTTEQLVASGFNRLNMVTREGGAQPAEYLAKYGADRVRTVATTWLGSTMGCCECHDHKFDPFSTRDFYSMKAFFADIKQWGVYMEYGYTPNPELRGFDNDHPFPPEIIVDSPYLHHRLDGIDQQIADLEKTAASKVKTDAAQKKTFDAWCDASAQFLKAHPDGWLTPKPELTQKKKKMATNEVADAVVNADDSILFDKKAPEEHDIELPLPAGWVAALRMELLRRPEHDGTIFSDKVNYAGTTVMLNAKVKAAAEGKPISLSFYHADADKKDERYSNGYAIIGVTSGWKVLHTAEKSPQTSFWLLDKPFQAHEGDKLVIKLTKGLVGCVRFSITPFAARDPLKSGGNAALADALSKGKRERLAKLYETYLIGTGADEKTFADYKKLYADALQLRGGKSPTVVTVAVKPVETRVLRRGNFQDEGGDVVVPAVPHFLPQVPDADGHRLTRLDLAKWLVSQDNPLTARTVMNRMWKQFFGTGISAVVDDLGAQGEWPTHPQLLDWLSVEFMDSGWDIKHMVKLMVMSETYRQSSNPRPEIHEMDPANRLYASQSPRRLEAEFIRDNALFVSGLLNEDIGGPSCFPYQPAGYYANIQFPNRDYIADTDDRQYRRGVYMHWQRTFLHPMLANFDAPSREECTAIRNVSNSPQQALTLLNDPTFVECSRMLAAKVLSHAPRNDDKRIDFMYQTVLARHAKPNERKSLESFLAEQRAYYMDHADDANKLMRVGLATEPKVAGASEEAAWTQVCRVMLGLHETITRY
ncbi:MAG TPA: PSD1 and planctomycete cytochrome C domain-containing protein [Verrucomicrobiae bacterium]|nr:PSD1 and planctomycete cytochrome C domain-containing protein [Verrucomicrobiae bacterium]